MRIKYRETKFQADKLQRILQLNQILAEYAGSLVSVRQLYYRLVAAGRIPNEVEEYKKTATLITEARYAGLIDWDSIEDRNREPQAPRAWGSGQSLLAEAAQQFRLPRWRGQPFYVELWVEKAALAGVLWPICHDYHLVLMVNRGYSSASAMKESADRISYHGRQARPTVLYIGDHDPSGEDMVRDVKDRLLEFGVPDWLDVRKLALTMEQIELHQPPPNPVRLTDARAPKYQAKYGDSS